MNRLRYCSLKMIDAKNEKYPSSCRQINYQSSLKKKKKNGSDVSLLSSCLETFFFLYKKLKPTTTDHIKLSSTFQSLIYPLRL